jgi:hypothetical protein
MATFTWNGYYGAGPAWTDIGANTLTFCSSLTDHDTAITVASYQDGNHITSGDPGSDVCLTNHLNNVKYLGASLMDVNGGGSEALNDTNLAENECTLKINFSHGSSVVITNARLYCYDGTTETTYASNVDMYAFERGVTATAWTEINNGGGATGGDNTGERLDLGDKTTATSHDWFVAVSMSPETVGAKTAMDLGIALTYS